jgi:hypothetical protein
MPGGSPTFKDASPIERLYEHLEILFEDLSAWCRGMTLKEFHVWFGSRLQNAPRALYCRKRCREYGQLA